MIPTEWFLESSGRNEFPEFNGTESGPYTIHTTPSHAQIDCRSLPTINLGVVNNPKPYSLTTTIIHNVARVAASSPPPVPTTTPNCHLPPSATTARLNTTRTRREHHVTAQEQGDHAMSLNERAPSRCHIAHSDVATRRQMTTSVVVRRRLYRGKSLPPSLISSE